MEQNTCNKCGRPMHYATEPKCNYNDCCLNEYCGCKLGRIKEIEPTCDSTAVIPSITVDSVEGITNLANCLVHVTSNNTTYYVDDKHRIMITWAGPVNIPGYDMEGNPNKYKDQIVTDTENGTAVIYDNHGKGYLFGITPDSLQEAVNNKLEEMVLDGTFTELITPIVAEYQEELKSFEKLTNWSNIEYTKYRDEAASTDYYITEIPYENPYGGNNVIRVGLANDDTTISGVEKPTDFAYRHKTPFVSNAGIFYSNRPNPTAYGLVIKDGVVLKNETISPGYYNDIIAIKEDGSMKSYPVGTNPQTIINAGYVDAIVGYYILIENGEVVDTSGYRDTGVNPRQIVCRKTNGDYLFLTCDGRTNYDKGLDLDDVVRILSNYDIDFAFVLDGGGSTSTIVKSSKINKFIDDDGSRERAVATMLYVDSSANELYTLNGRLHNENMTQKANLDLRLRQMPSIDTAFSGNLFNRNNPNFLVNKYIENGEIIDYTNTGAEDNDTMLSDYIQIPAGQDFYVVSDGLAQHDWCLVYAFDENKNWMYAIDYYTATDNVIKPRARVSYIRVIMRKRYMPTFGIYLGSAYNDHFEEYRGIEPVTLFENLAGATSATLGYIGRYQKIKIYVVDSSSQQDSKEVLLGRNEGTVYTFFSRVHQTSTNSLDILTSRVYINKADGAVTIDREYSNTLTPTPAITLTDNSGRLKIIRVEGL